VKDARDGAYLTQVRLLLQRSPMSDKVGTVRPLRDKSGDANRGGAVSADARMSGRHTVIARARFGGSRLRSGVVSAAALTAIAIAGCAAGSSDDDFADDTSPAALETLSPTNLHIDSAKVLFDGVETGFPECDEKIGSADGTASVTLTATQREACKMLDLGPKVKDRLGVILTRIAEAGVIANSFQQRGARVELAEIRFNRVKKRSQQYTNLDTKLSVAGSQGQFKATFAWVLDEIVTTFVFRQYDADNNETGLRQVSYPTLSPKAYQFVPYSVFDTSSSFTLNVGAILSFLGASNPMTQPIISAIGNSASLEVSSKTNVVTSGTQCIDVGAKGKSSIGAFESYLIASVMVPLCNDYLKANGRASEAARCDKLKGFIGDGTQFLERALADVQNNSVFPLRSCVPTGERGNASLGGGVFVPTYQVRFVAPKIWGFGPNQRANLFEQQKFDYRSWEQVSGANDWMTVQAIDERPNVECGYARIRNDEVCVTAQVRRNFWESTCKSVNETTSKALYVGASQAKAVEGKIVWSQSPNPANEDRVAEADKRK